MGMYKPESINELFQLSTGSLAENFYARATATISASESDPIAFLLSYENGRKRKQSVRQYIFNGSGATTSTIDSGATSPLNHYCVKLGDLCPQLRNLAVVDASKLLARGGLMISVKLLEKV